MDAETRLNKRIEIASRFMAGIASTAGGANEIRKNTELYSRFAITVADAIIDTAIGDMTAEIKEGIK